jgi:hypothetical protein
MNPNSNDSILCDARQSKTALNRRVPFSHLMFSRRRTCPECIEGTATNFVIPAKAGIHFSLYKSYTNLIKN